MPRRRAAAVERAAAGDEQAVDAGEVDPLVIPPERVEAGRRADDAGDPHLDEPLAGSPEHHRVEQVATAATAAAAGGGHDDRRPPRRRARLRPRPLKRLHKKKNTKLMKSFKMLTIQIWFEQFEQISNQVAAINYLGIICLSVGDSAEVSDIED